MRIPTCLIFLSLPHIKRELSIHLSNTAIYQQRMKSEASRVPKPSTQPAKPSPNLVCTNATNRTQTYHKKVSSSFGSTIALSWILCHTDAHKSHDQQKRNGWVLEDVMSYSRHAAAGGSIIRNSLSLLSKEASRMSASFSRRRRHTPTKSLGLEITSTPPDLTVIPMLLDEVLVVQSLAAGWQRLDITWNF